MNVVLSKHYDRRNISVNNRNGSYSNSNSNSLFSSNSSSSRKSGSASNSYCNSSNSNSNSSNPWYPLLPALARTTPSPLPHLHRPCLHPRYQPLSHLCSSISAGPTRMGRLPSPLLPHHSLSKAYPLLPALHRALDSRAGRTMNILSLPICLRSGPTTASTRSETSEHCGTANKRARSSLSRLVLPATIRLHNSSSNSNNNLSSRLVDKATSNPSSRYDLISLDLFYLLPTSVSFRKICILSISILRPHTPYPYLSP